MVLSLPQLSEADEVSGTAASLTALDNDGG
jgi:hypothetical protein